MKLQDYKKQYDELSVKKNLTGEEALVAVKKNGEALKYVNSDMFEDEEILELNGKKYKLID